MLTAVMEMALPWPDRFFPLTFEQKRHQDSGVYSAEKEVFYFISSTR